MFHIQPVRSREEQKIIAEQLDTEYYEDTYAFCAVESDPKTGQALSLIGLCQFTLNPEMSEIRTVSSAPGYEEDEAMTILIRTVMSSAFKAEIPYIAIDESVLTKDKILKLGFRFTDNKWIIDLKKFYESPCHYNSD